MSREIKTCFKQQRNLKVCSEFQHIVEGVLQIERVTKSTKMVWKTLGAITWHSRACPFFKALNKTSHYRKQFWSNMLLCVKYAKCGNCANKICNVGNSLRSTERKTKKIGTHNKTLEIPTLTSEIPDKLNV